MKINKMHINGYGKLKGTNIELKDGINVIYGENEVGKSTLLNFITTSFYGISKKKNGKELSDFEKYTPWNNEEFSGKLEYILDNNKKYEIFRNFKKKNPTIYNEKMEDISKEFNIDKTKGNEFFIEQTGVDEELFKSTFLTEQQEVKLSDNNQHMLIQKISNLVGTGEDNVSYRIAMDRLKRKQLDEVGTERSREKPINILTREIAELQEEKEKLEDYKDMQYDIEENKNKLQEEIRELEKEVAIAKEIKKISDKKFLGNEKIKIQENIEKENLEKINNLINEKNKIENKEEKIEKDISENKKEIKNKIKKLNKNIILIFLLVIFINIFQFILIKNKYFNYIFLLTVPTVLIFYIFLKNNLKNKLNKKIENKELEEIKLEKNKIENEINIINENNKIIKNEINTKKEKINLETNLEKEKIKNKFKINNLKNEKNIENEIETIQNLLNRKNLEIHQYELDKNNIEPKLDNLSNLEEKLVNDKIKYVNIKNKNRSIELAKEVLTSSYQKMKEEVTPKFTKQISQNIGIITKGKYSKAMYNDEQGLIIEQENGDYVTANKLSIGTIDQLYLSLRLSMINDLSEEKLPIILDESFAYYDNKRLENILIYLSKEFSNRQIIIFTCTNREKQILDDKKIDFNYVVLK